MLPENPGHLWVPVAYAHPRRVVFLDRLPLGGAGKLDRAALRGRAAEAGPAESGR